MPDNATFDADRKMLENTSRVVKIGGEEWHPAKRTGNVAKRLAALGDPPDANESPEAVAENMDYLYDNISILLVNAEGEHPSREWLLDNLEWNIAQEMIQFLNPELAQPVPPTTPSLTPQDSGIEKPLPQPVAFPSTSGSNETPTSVASTN